MDIAIDAARIARGAFPIAIADFILAIVTFALAVESLIHVNYSLRCRFHAPAPSLFRAAFASIRLDGWTAHWPMPQPFQRLQRREARLEPASLAEQESHDASGATIRLPRTDPRYSPLAKAGRVRSLDPDLHKVIGMGKHSPGPTPTPTTPADTSAISSPCAWRFRPARRTRDTARWLAVRAGRSDTGSRPARGRRHRSAGASPGDRPC